MGDSIFRSLSLLAAARNEIGLVLPYTPGWRYAHSMCRRQASARFRAALLNAGLPIALTRRRQAVERSASPNLSPLRFRAAAAALLRSEISFRSCSASD